LIFFSPGALAVFLREGYAGYVVPCRILVMLWITSFLPSVRRLEFPLFDEGAGALLQSPWGVLGLCALWRAGLPSTSRVVGLPLSGGPGIPVLVLERRSSPAGRCSVKCWASVYLGETELLMLPAE
jgi:hypothetical protein